MVDTGTSGVTTIAGRPLMAADIGGTYARLSLVVVRRGTASVTLLARRKYACADYLSLLEIIRTFLHECGSGTVRRGVLACAGYAIDGTVINTNLAWSVDVHALRDALHMDDLALINDFEAAAYGVQYADLRAATWLTRNHGDANKGAQVVVGAGTGLGSAIVLPDANPPIVLAAEAGQTALAPGNQLEGDILRILARANGRHVSYERALSGPGLLNVYRALCALTGAEAHLDTPETVGKAAAAGHDPEAHQAVNVFYGLFGSFVGDLAILYNATGGITLIGGVLAGTRQFLLQGPFLERFADKGHMRRLLQTIPVRLVEMDQLGIIGAAAWYAHCSRREHSGSVSKGPVHLKRVTCPTPDT